MIPHTLHTRTRTTLKLFPNRNPPLNHRAPAMPPPQTPPSLPDELLEEIFLRLPPDEPEHLVRASLASKLWLGHLSGPRFRGRYHEHHGAPPMLGFLHDWLEGCYPDEKDPIPHFTSTAKFGPRIPNDKWPCFDYSALDCRHGRVLLGDSIQSPNVLVVWDPMTGCRRELVSPDLVVDGHRAAVLCAVSGCDHRTCHAGPFKVVFVGVDMEEDEDDDCVAYAYVSLPETGDWSKPCPLFDQWGESCPGLYLPADAFIQPIPPVLIEEALYFMLEYADDYSVEILKYDLSSHSLSLIDGPIEDSEIASASILMAMEDGSLGFAHVYESILYLYSGLMDFNGVGSWTQRTIINLTNLLRIQNPMESLRLVGSVEGGDVVFVTTELGIYEINVESQQWKKLCKRKKLYALVPYMSFYTPQERVMPTDAAH